VSEIRPDFVATRTTVREPGAPPVAARLPKQIFVMDFAGDLAVSADSAPTDDDEPTRLVVHDWRTGSVRFTAKIPEGIDDADLRADGRVLVERADGAIVEVAPGGAGVRLVSPDGIRPAKPATAVVFVRSAEREGDES
jgi:hypothetical protein